MLGKLIRHRMRMLTSSLLKTVDIKNLPLAFVSVRVKRNTFKSFCFSLATPEKLCRGAHRNGKGSDALCEIIRHITSNLSSLYAMRSQMAL